MGDPHRGWRLVLLVLVIAHPCVAQALERYETELNNCTLTRNARRLPCHGLVLQQADDHSLRIRFIGSERPSGASVRLTYVSRDLSNHDALVCQEQRCRLTQSTWTGQVTSGSWIRFNARGLPDGASGAKLMTGECRITTKQVICDSRTSDGEHLRAEARL